LLEIKTWGTKWKMAIDKIDEWAAWQWANANINKKSFALLKTNCKHSKGGYGRLPLGNVYTCHGFFQRTRKFEKNDSRTFFHELTQQFVDKGFNNLWQPAINTIYETYKTIICNFR
jgi:hypothetical protein